MPSWRAEEIRGEVLARAGWEIRPVARVSRVTWRGGRLEWHRPVAVEVSRGARVARVAIRDVARRALVGLALADGVLGVLGIVARRSGTQRRLNT